MQPSDPEPGAAHPSSPERPGAPESGPVWVEAPPSPLKRLLAAVALAALLASGAYLSWWVLTGQAAADREATASQPTPRSGSPAAE